MTDWLRLILAYAAGLAGAWQLGKLPPLLAELRAALDLDPVTAGAVATMTTLVAIVLSPAAGRLITRLGPDRSLFAATAVIALGAALVALADGATVLLIGRVIESLGYVLVIVAGPTAMALAARTDRDRGLALSIWGTFVPVGLALGSLTGGLMADGVGLSGALAVAALPPAMIALACLPHAWRPAPASIDGPATGGPAGAGATGWWLAIGFGCFALAFILLIAFAPGHWRRIGGLGPGAAGIAVSIVSTLAVLGSLLAARLIAGGAAPARLGLWFVTGQGLFAAAALLAPNLPLSIGLAAIASILGGVVPSAAFAAVPRLARAPSGIAAINAAISSLGSLGTFLGGPLGALAVERFGGAGVAGVALIATAFAIAAFHRADRPASAS